MGVFQAVFALGGKGSGYRKAARKLERSQANARIEKLTRAINFRATEDPRERAHQNQTLFARGIGKSTIAESDKTRLATIQEMRNADLERDLDLARKYKKYINKKHSYENKAVYAAALDGILSIALGAGGGASAVGGGGGEYSYGQQGGGNQYESYSYASYY